MCQREKTEKTGGKTRILAYASVLNVVVDKPVKYENWRLFPVALRPNAGHGLHIFFFF